MLEIIVWHLKNAALAGLVGSVWAIVILAVLSVAVMFAAPPLALWWNAYARWLRRAFPSRE